MVRDGAAIPVDGIVESGNALVNQASMTGESIPAARERGGSVSLPAPLWKLVQSQSGFRKLVKATRLHQVLGFIRQSEAEKSSLEAQYTKAGRSGKFRSHSDWPGWRFCFHKNLARAASVLLVDYSCAISWQRLLPFSRPCVRAQNMELP